MHHRFRLVGSGRDHAPLVDHEQLLKHHPHRRADGGITPIDKASAFISDRLGFDSHAVGYDMDRRVMRPEYLDSVMQTNACKMALSEAGWDPQDVQLFVCMTSTPDYIRFPHQAGVVAKALGLGGNSDFHSINIDAGCGGFAHSLEMVKLMAYAGFRKVLISAGNCYSAFMDLTDEEYCYQSNLNVSVFGDGAGAVAFEVIDTHDEVGLIAHSSVENMENPPMAFKHGGCASPFRPGLKRSDTQYFMYGSTVAEFAPRLMAEAYSKLMKTHRFSLNEVDLLIPHQANPGAIMRDLAGPLGIPEEKVWLGGKRVGNIAVACLPFGLDEAIKDGRIRKGSLVALVAIGAGNAAWTGGASLIVI